MPRPRFTLSRMMIAAAVVCVPLATIGRSQYLAAEGRRHRAEASSLASRIESLAFDEFISRPRPGYQIPTCAEPRARERAGPEEERDVELAYGRGSVMHRLYRRWRYHDSLAEKYKEAAHHPWLPVSPDPPEPVETVSRDRGD